MERYEASNVSVEGEQTSNEEDDENENPVLSARSARARARAIANKLEETVTLMKTSEQEVQTAQDALKITERDMSLMNQKLLDNRSIEKSLIKHAGKLHRWHSTKKIDKSTVLKAANEYTKRENFIPYDEFKSMSKVQRVLIWHAAQAKLYNMLVQFSYIYNKRKLQQNGKALFDELKKLAAAGSEQEAAGCCGEEGP